MQAPLNVYVGVQPSNVLTVEERRRVLLLARHQRTSPQKEQASPSRTNKPSHLFSHEILWYMTPSKNTIDEICPLYSTENTIDEICPFLA